MSLASDLRYLHRSVTRSPGQAVAVWACTAVWIAVAPAFLSLLGALQWKSFPFPEPDRIVQVNAGFDLLPALAETGRFQALSRYQEGWFVVDGPRGSASVVGAAVDPGFFEVMAIPVLAGRVFTPDSTSADAGGAVLTAGLCRRLFGVTFPPRRATLHLGGRELAIVGVVPDRPVYPPLAELWVLRLSGLRPDPAFLPPDIPQLGMVARLAEGTSVQAADATLRVLVQEVEKRGNLSQGDVEVLSLAELLRRRSPGERGILRVSLAGLLGFVLLAYSSALSSFLLERQGEFAVRIALGARRPDLFRLLFLAAFFLAIPGFLIGTAMSFVVLRRLTDLVPLPVAELIPPELDMTSLSLAVAGWAIVTIVSVSWNWLSAPRMGLDALLVPGRAETKRTRPQALPRLALVSLALGLAVALGAVTALLRQSLVNLQQESLGFEPRNAISAVVRFAEPPAPEHFATSLARISDHVEAVPGVATVAFSDSLLFGGPGIYLEISHPDRSRFWLARYRGIAGDYVKAAGIRLIAGREITLLEQATGAPVALLDAEGAREVFAERSPIGGTIVLQDRPVTIVGIVSSTKGSSLDEPQQPQVYLPLKFALRESAPGAVAMIVRLSDPVRERDLSSAVETAGGSVSQYRPVTQSVQASLASQRLARDLATLQWAWALALITLATFGTFSWLLEMRAHELAVRFALGDTRRGIAWRLVRRLLWPLVMAILLGLALYLPASQALHGLLFGVESLSPGSLLKAVAEVAMAAFAAAILATRIALQRLSLDPLRSSRLG